MSLRGFIIAFVSVGVFTSQASCAEDVKSAKNLVALLASKNLPPHIADRSSRPAFATEFSWSEQSRVQAVAEKLFGDIDNCWPAIVDGVDDSRYAVTMWVDGYSYNYTVGDLCMIILRDSLTAVFWDVIPPDGRIVNEMKRLRMIDGESPDRRWFAKKRDAHFHELQIQSAHWAKSQIRRSAVLNEPEIHESVAKLEMGISAMKTKASSVMKGRLEIPDIRHVYAED
jgi:hypothetical protein